MTRNNRRSFLEKTGALAATAFLSYLPKPLWAKKTGIILPEAGEMPNGIPGDEADFWRYIQQSFTVSPAIINLNNGGVSPAPKTVQDAVKRYYDYCNEAPSYYMWQILDQGREPLRKNLAKLAGCDAEEIAINRNSSEGLETIIFGLPLKTGDEVVASRQDYPNVINAYKQRELRDVIRMVWIYLE